MQNYIDDSNKDVFYTQVIIINFGVMAIGYIVTLIVNPYFDIIGFVEGSHDTWLASVLGAIVTYAIGFVASALVGTVEVMIRHMLGVGNE